MPSVLQAGSTRLSGPLFCTLDNVPKSQIEGPTRRQTRHAPAARRAAQLFSGSRLSSAHQLHRHIERGPPARRVSATAANAVMRHLRI